MDTPDNNLSTDHQPKGSARNLSDTLDRTNEQVDPGQRQWSADSSEPPDFDQNGTVRRGGEAEGGIEPHEGDVTSPAAADARAEARDREQQDSGFGDDRDGSTYRS